MIKFEIINLKNVTSTNDIAIKLIKENKKKAGCINAEAQTNGRGTNGKKWISEKGNLFTSLFFPLKKDFPPFNEFSIVNSIIISDVIQNFCSEKKVSLKFPNDIFLNNKKICGLLQELITVNGISFLIIGIGLNLISNPEINEKYQATNMLLETKKKKASKDILEEIIKSYEKFFINLESYSYKSFKKKAQILSLN